MPAPKSPKGVILISAYDGTRKLIPSGKELLFRILDGNQKARPPISRKKPILKAQVPVFDNLADNYTVIVSGKGYRQAGFHPVKVLPDIVVPLDLMLLPQDATFQFHDATWKNLRLLRPAWTRFLQGNLDEDAAANRHAQWMEDTPAHLAAFLNFAEALDDIVFRIGIGFDYLKQACTGDLAQDFLPDRFFAFADAAIVGQLEAAVGTNFEAANSSLHPGATRSFKEKRFGEANVQITLHENDRKRIGGVNCIKVEIDMDYFRDPLAHLLLEVLPNQFGGATDPRQIYMLRWIAGRHTGVSEFNPPYSIA